MRSSKFFLAAALLLLGHAPLSGAADPLRIVATTTTLADFARHVAGPEAEVYSIASPKRNLHFVSPTPKDVMKVRKAAVFIHSGVDAEPWKSPLLDAAGNPRFLGEGRGLVDASPGIEILEKPVVLTRLEGDLHAAGNPHTWTDPENAAIQVHNITEALASLYPDRADTFRKNGESYAAKIREQAAAWAARLAPYKGTVVVQYHRSWPYMARRFGFEIAGDIEPKPGIPSTGRHLAGLIQIMKERKARLIFLEPYFDDSAAKKVASETGAAIVRLSQFVGGVKDTGDYVTLMEYNVSQIEKALAAGGA